jgi:hypothetical protein
LIAACHPDVISAIRPDTSSPGGPQHLLLEEDYFSLMLSGMLNPVLVFMRGKPFEARAERCLRQEIE